MSRFLDTIREIFYYLRQYKSRTAMTMFGIIWGTLTVILLLAFGVGVKKSISKNMHGMGEGIALVWPSSTSMPYQGYGRGRAIRVSDDEIELLRREIPSIQSISPEYSQWGTAVRVGEKKIQPNVTGIVPEYGPMRNIWPDAGGRWLNDKDMEERRRVVFLGNKLRDFLFGENADAVGKYVLIGETPFMVVGVLIHKIQSSSYNSRDEDRAFIPAETFKSIFGHRYVSNFLYKTTDPRLGEMTKKRMYEVFSKRFKFHPDDEETLGIWDTSEMEEFIFYFSMGFNGFMGLIGVITLIVGGIGLANIMYVVVQERTREIGIRRSIGARQRNILGQFVLEAFIILGLSAAIGFVLALGLIKVIAMMPIEDYVGIPELNMTVALITMLILCVIGFFAGFFPARRASKLDVVECLRS